MYIINKRHIRILWAAQFLGMITSCTEIAQQPSASKPLLANNQELELLVARDQAMRQKDAEEPTEPTDQIHRKRVMEMLANGQVKTPQDKFNASLILQHTALTYCNEQLQSISPENYYLAYTLAKSASESGLKNTAYMVAATFDRYLLYTEGYQKYGTQKIIDEKTNDFVWAPIDTATSDQERAKYDVKPLAELLKESPMAARLKNQ